MTKPPMRGATPTKGERADRVESKDEDNMSNLLETIRLQTGIDYYQEPAIKMAYVIGRFEYWLKLSDADERTIVANLRRVLHEYEERK